MMPRPRSRKRPVRTPDLAELADEVAACRSRPLAIAVGTREWQMARRQPDYRARAEFWPGGEETFAGVPLIVRRDLGNPQLLRTQADMEEALLPAD